MPRPTRNSCAVRSPVQSIGHARSCRRRVAAYWKLERVSRQNRDRQNRKRQNRDWEPLERADMAVTKLQISPVIVNGFENGFHQRIQRIFLVVWRRKKIVFRFF